MNDNQLIAEFMGAVQDKVHAPIGEYMWYEREHFGSHLYHKDRLLYRKSWDWIMPVVSKIAEYRLAHPKQCSWVCDCKIVVFQRILYREVVNFIKWYNQNEKL